MGWAVVSVAGFVLVTAVVTAMARSNTARWERDHRAAQAAARARAATARSGWAAVLGRRGAEPPRRPRRPHRHLPHPHLPHPHLPAGVVARLPHPHLPDVHLPRRSRDKGRPAEPRADADAS